MSATPEDNSIVERRAFPRIQASCPVLYQLRENSRWLVAKLEEYSATGIRMICDDNLSEGTEIAIEIKPGSQKTIPGITAQARVVRVAESDENQFRVSCKILKVMRNK